MRRLFFVFPGSLFFDVHLIAGHASNTRVSLTWTASTGPTGYNVKPSTTSSGPYTIIASPAAVSYTDFRTNYYVVSAANSAGESADATQVTATPTNPTTTPDVTIDATKSQAISPYIYGLTFLLRQQRRACLLSIALAAIAGPPINWETNASNTGGDYLSENRLPSRFER